MEKQGLQYLSFIFAITIPLFLDQMSSFKRHLLILNSGQVYTKEDESSGYVLFCSLQTYRRV